MTDHRGRQVQTGRRTPDILLGQHGFEQYKQVQIDADQISLLQHSAKIVSLSPAHAHLNLLGWVTMTLYGLYHRGAPRNTMALRWVQIDTGGPGFPAFAGGLAVYLATGNGAVFVVGLVGVVLCILSMILFLGMLLRDARTPEQ